MECVVLKPITGDDVDYKPGDIVDTTEWRWEHQLIEQKKLRPIKSHAASPAETEANILSPKKRGRPRKSSDTV